MKDKDLIHQIRTGHIEVYGELIRRYHKRVMGSCLARLNNERDAEEAAQDIFVKAYHSLKKFRGNSSFSTWLYRITANHCVDVLRWRNRQKTYSLEELVEQKGDKVQGLFGNPDKALSDIENRDLVQKILSTLPPDYRIIMTMREGEGSEFKEIAEVLKCTPIAVRGRLARAREKLRETINLTAEPRYI